jgi:hypothetical protein
MMLVDTSIIIPIFRDKSGGRRKVFRDFLAGRDYQLTRFTQIELLQGCKNTEQWGQMRDYLQHQSYAEATADTWPEAALIGLDLDMRRTIVNSILDCCIAQIAIERRLLVVHNDADFEKIATVRSLRQHRFDIRA